MSYPGERFDTAWREAHAPANHINPRPKSHYHQVVIGAGPAGLISAIGAAGLGADVALVEAHRMGGDCLNVGCVPSKSLLEYTARGGRDFDEAFAWLREVRASIAPHDSVARYRELGVDVFLGRARLERGERVAVGETMLAARRIAICTGARPVVPPIPGLRDADPLTNETVFDLTERPARLAILGAGPIGCELAQALARLGVEVHLFELAPRVLPGEINEASAVVAAALERDGVRLHVGAPVTTVDGRAPVRISTGEASIEVDRVLVALGRRPNTDDLGLEQSGVALDGAFIQVDAKLRTTNRRIFAAGDCASPVQFTHHADAQARALVQNALFAPTARVDRLIVPHCTYTHPEVATIGAQPHALAPDTFDLYRIGFGELDRGRTQDDRDGFAQVLTRKGSDTILGATIVGRDAGEQLAPIGLLMANGLGLGAARRAVYAYPTRSEYLKRLADAYYRTRLTPTTARLLGTWLRFTRRVR
jgi:pyruvate/2-oxoglutarate dehydrogenase complex dihydrolipoamide dehydrogenase (E3) component